MINPLGNADKAILGLADRTYIISSLSRFRHEVCPPWLPIGHPLPDGVVPRDAAAFAAVSHADIITVLAVRGPLHAIDGWSYLGRAFNCLLSGQPHSARHLAYYAELRAALSILASAGIGVFNRCNVVADAAGVIHQLSGRPTHEIAWLSLVEWSLHANSIERILKPFKLGANSVLDHLRIFFPAHVSAAAGPLISEWGFDLQQGTIDKDERNTSSYQPTALTPIITSPADDLEFLNMFWNACRPGGIELERHLLRGVLEAEARIHGLGISGYPHHFDLFDDGTKALVSYEFLTRQVEGNNHPFLSRVADSASPASPYAMMCRAGLLLKLATGMADDNLRSAGVQSELHLSNWWQQFGADIGLWPPGGPPDSCADLWGDISSALEDCSSAPRSHRHEWINSIAGNALKVCEAERVGLWSLFQ